MKPKKSRIRSILFSKPLWRKWGLGSNRVAPGNLPPRRSRNRTWTSPFIRLFLFSLVDAVRTSAQTDLSVALRCSVSFAMPCACGPAASYTFGAPIKPVWDQSVSLSNSVATDSKLRSSLSSLGFWGWTFLQDLPTQGRFSFEVPNPGFPDVSSYPLYCSSPEGTLQNTLLLLSVQNGDERYSPESQRKLSGNLSVAVSFCNTLSVSCKRQTRRTY